MRIPFSVPFMVAPHALLVIRRYIPNQNAE
jgi:hypothetical protein